MFEHLFDYGWVAVTPLPTRPDPRSATIAELRSRMEQVQGGPRVPVETTPGLSGLVRLRTGSSYRIDESSIALSLLAAPSRAGSWVAVVGVPDLGVEAAAEYGLNLDRTVLVPDPAGHWPEVAAALVDVAPLVWLRTTGTVRRAVASRLAARLRKRSTTLLVQGEWPGCEAHLRIAGSQWYGAEDGHGRLRSRLVTVECVRGSAPARTTQLWLPGEPEHVVTVGRDDHAATGQTRLEAVG